MSHSTNINENMEAVFKKENISPGRSVKINFKISDPSFKTFKTLKLRQGCKTSKDVFNYIYLFAKIQGKELLKDNEVTLNGGTKSWHSFTLDDNLLSMFNDLAKSVDISIDELLDVSLMWMGAILDYAKQKNVIKKYRDRDTTMKAIGEIWSQVSELRAGLDYVFEVDYDSIDPKNYNCWFADIEGGLQELETLVPKLFDEAQIKGGQR